MRLILATHNPDKRKELEAILRAEMDSTVEILTLDDIPVGEIEETGETLEDNALLKARAVFEETGIPAVADDTGLEVKALGGAPGVYSARYAGEGATYEANVRKLLQELGGTEERQASFISVIAFCEIEKEAQIFRGEVHGKIAYEPRGTNGFGYDPVFIPGEPGDRTYAELSPEEKNENSHRGKAMRLFAKFLHSQLVVEQH